MSYPRRRPIAAATLRLVATLLAVGLAAPEATRGQDPAEPESARQDPEVEWYGFVFAQGVAESSRTGRDPHLNIQPLPGQARAENDEPDAFFDVRPSRLGLTVRTHGDGSPDVFGNLEVDFDTPGGAPRIRHAYGEINLGAWRILAGQTWSIVSQLNPTTINNDNLFNLGNTYERVPQIRFSYRRDVAEGALELQLGGVTFFGAFDQAGLAIQAAEGSNWRVESNTPPVAQGRLQYGWPVGERRARLALGASVGQVQARSAAGAEDEVAHALVVGELLLPLSDRVEIMAEAFYGQAPGFNGGIGQSVVATSADKLEPVTSRGGFAQLRVAPSALVSVNLIAGLDDPMSAPGGFPLLLGRNETVMGNLFWHAARGFTFAFELQYLRSEYEARALAADNVRSTFAMFLTF